MKNSNTNKSTFFSFFLTAFIVLGLSVCQNAHSSALNGMYKNDRQYLLSFNDAVKEVSKIYNTDIIIEGRQPEINFRVEIEGKLILNDLRKIITNYGISNHALMYDNKNNSIKIFIIDSGANKSISLANKMETQYTEYLGFDDNRSLSQEQILLLAQADNSGGFDKNLEQPLSKEQMTQLQNASNPDYIVREMPLTSEQMELLQKIAKKQGLGISESDMKPLSFEQMTLLQDLNGEMVLEDEAPLSDEQRLLLDQNKE